MQFLRTAIGAKLAAIATCPRRRLARINLSVFGGLTSGDVADAGPGTVVARLPAPAHPRFVRRSSKGGQRERSVPIRRYGAQPGGARRLDPSFDRRGSDASSRPVVDSRMRSDVQMMDRCPSMIEMIRSMPKSSIIDSCEVLERASHLCDAPAVLTRRRDRISFIARRRHDNQPCGSRKSVDRLEDRFRFTL